MTSLKSDTTSSTVLDLFERSSDLLPSASATNSFEPLFSPYKQYTSTPSPRTNIPTQLTTPPDGDLLQISLMRLWQMSEPTEQRKKDMDDLRTSLTDVINQTFCPEGGRRFEVEIVGSTSWGGGIDTSTDVDLIIVDRELPRGYVPERWIQPPDTPSAKHSKTEARLSKTIHTSGTNNLPGCYSLESLSDCMKSIGLTHIVKCPRATPLLQFVDPGRRLGCDLQCDNLSGMYNCSLILHYCQISPYILRPMINTIKNWYKVISGKDPKTSNKVNKFKLSSYCLSLICISYLQHIGQLPNLQVDVPARIYEDEQEMWDDEELIWTDWGRLRGIPAHTSCSKSPKQDWKATNGELMAAQAVRGFFEYFSSTKSSRLSSSDNIEGSIAPKDRCDPTKYIISPVNGGILPRSTKFQDPTFDKLIQDQITYLKRRGFLENQIQVIIDEWISVKSRSLEMKMGKGDLGIQPYRWANQIFVVQDPFKWSKNQAETMTDEAYNEFIRYIDRTHEILLGSGLEADMNDILDIERYQVE